MHVNKNQAQGGSIACMITMLDVHVQEQQAQLLGCDESCWMHVQHAVFTCLQYCIVTRINLANHRGVVQYTGG